VIAAVCASLGVEPQDLARAGRDRLIARGRATSRVGCAEHWGGTLTEIGRRFGRDISTLSRQVAEIEKRAVEATAQGRALRFRQKSKHGLKRKAYDTLRL